MFKTINKLNIILGGMLLLIAVYLFLCAQNNSLENNRRGNNNNIINISQVCFKNKCFNVEIANTLEEKRIGLMNRKYLDPNNGMLFVFDQASVYNLWMKNTLIPLDMIWIDENNKIFFIKENAQPCKTDICESFGLKKKALYVLEINGGISKETGIEVGDGAEFK